MQPTAAWNHIQEQLSKLEQLEKELAEAREEIRLLSDENQFLDEAALSEEKQFINSVKYEALKQEHESLLSRLPKNANECWIFSGAKAFMKRDGEILEIEIAEVDTKPDRTIETLRVRQIFYDGAITFYPKPDELYPTFESCQSAQTEGEA